MGTLKVLIMDETVKGTNEGEGTNLDDSYEVYWPEEEEPQRRGLRREALILLITFLLPTLLILLEFLTGGVGPLIHATKTAIPHLLPAVNF
jgi:hypothetical protein